MSCDAENEPCGSWGLWSAAFQREADGAIITQALELQRDNRVLP